MKYRIELDEETFHNLQHALSRATRIEHPPSTMELRFAGDSWDQKVRYEQIPVDKKKLREAMRAGCMLTLTIRPARIPRDAYSFLFTLSWRDHVGRMWNYDSHHPVQAPTMKECETKLRIRIRSFGIKGNHLKGLLAEGIEQMMEVQLQKSAQDEKRRVVDWFRRGRGTPETIQIEPIYHEAQKTA